MSDKDRKKLVALMRQWAACLRDGSALSLSCTADPTCTETGMASLFEFEAQQIERTIG